jgi:hypothetical protein
VPIRTRTRTRETLDEQATSSARRMQDDDLAQFADAFAVKMADFSGLQRQLKQIVESGQ